MLQPSNKPSFIKLNIAVIKLDLKYRFSQKTYPFL